MVQQFKLPIIAATLAVTIGLALTWVLAMDKATAALEELEHGRGNAIVSTAQDLLQDIAASEHEINQSAYAKVELDHLAQNDPKLEALLLVDTSGKILHQAGYGERVERAFVAKFPSGANGKHKTATPDHASIHTILDKENVILVYGPVLSSSGKIIGWIEARYDLVDHDKRLGLIGETLLAVVGGLIVATALFGLVMARAFTKRDPLGGTTAGNHAVPAEQIRDRFRVRMLIALPVAMAILLGAVFYFFEHELLDGANDKAGVLVSLAETEILDAHQDDGDTARSTDIDGLLAHFVDDHPEIGGAQLIAADRTVIAEVGATATAPLVEKPLTDKAGRALTLVLYIASDYIPGLLASMTADLLVVLFVAMFGAWEVMRFALAAAFKRAEAGSAMERQPETTRTSVEEVRFPVFLYFLGVELTRPFFPLFVGDLYDPILPIGRDIAIALPMSAWVIVMVLVTPFAGQLIRSRGIGHVLIVGMVPTMVGLLLTATAQTIWDLTVWRCVTAAGFGLVTVAAVLFATTAARTEQKTRSIGVFVAASIAASVCASAIGGILADRIGERSTFVVAGMLIGLAMLVTRRARLDLEQNRKVDQARVSGAWLTPLRDPGFVAFMVFAAIPSRIVLTGLTYLLLPLSLDALGYDASAIGRLMMLFFVSMLLLIPVTGRLAGSLSGHRLVLLAGCVAATTGAGLLALGQITEGPEQLAFLALSAVAIGASQCIGRAPMIAYLSVGFPGLKTQIDQAALLVSFRMLERIGSVGGPIIVAALSQSLGYPMTAAVLAGWLLVNAVGLGSQFALSKHPRARLRNDRPATE